MKLTEQKRLNRKDQEAVRNILIRSHEKENFSITFPLLEPNTEFFTARDDETDEIRAILALSRLTDTEYEVSAFTDPPFRKQGLFHQLWEKAKLSLPGRSMVDGPVSVRFANESALKDALPVLLSIGAALSEEQTEMKAELKGTQQISGDYTFRRSAPSGEGVIRMQAVSKEDSRPVMECYLMPMKDKGCYLHRIAVRKDLIGNGVGKSVFPEFLAVLYRQGFRTAKLQVDAANIPAVNLYKANGFSVTTRLRYYVVLFE